MGRTKTKHKTPVSSSSVGQSIRVQQVRLQLLRKADKALILEHWRVSHTQNKPSALIILAIPTQDRCHKNDTAKQFGSFPCTSVGQTEAPLALNSFLLYISHTGTCSVLHPLLPHSDIFWSVCWRGPGILPLWVEYLSSPSPLGCCCQPQEESSVPCETILCQQKLRAVLVVCTQTVLHPHHSLRPTHGNAEKWATIHLVDKHTEAPTSCSVKFCY